MLSDEEIDRLLCTQIPGGSAARDWFLPHELPKGLENVRGVVRAIIAAYQAKLRHGVELPEDLEQEIYQRSREFVSTNVEDAIRDIAYQYAAAVAAQAREEALEQCLIKVTGLSVDVERCKQLQLTTQAWEEALDAAANAIEQLKEQP